MTSILKPQPEKPRTPSLVASAKPGVHQVRVFNCYIRKSGFLKPTDKYSVKRFMYARVRRETFIDPTPQDFIGAVLKVAHNILERNAQEYSLNHEL